MSVVVVEQRCFHCGEDVPPGENRTVTVEGAPRPVCCSGCQAVASMILGSGLDEFYRFRDALPGQPEDEEAAAGDRGRWAAYDREELQREFVHHHGDGRSEVALLIEGLYCAACCWLIERALQRWPGVVEIHVNPATGRARLVWESERVPLSGLLAELERIGYQGHPLRVGAARDMAAQERRRALRRLAVAGLGMMQAMMFAVGLYAGEYYGMELIHQEMLRWVSLLVATPVVLYSGFPFFHGLYRDLRALSPGMDVPVGLAIGSAYLASVYMTVTGGAEVYFDSVTMFVFLLLIARYAEMVARHHASDTADALASLTPSTATRITPEGEELVAARELMVGDEVLIRPGESVPADGTVVWGEGSVDEAMLTGEAMPRRRSTGDRVVGGSINVAGTVRVRVEAVGTDTVLSGIVRLLERAQSDRPRLARLADWVARRFVTVVLILAAAVYAYWLQHDPSQAFLILLAVLIATCPCALAMATPMALAGGTSRLALHGLLVTRRDALEGLAKATYVVFDKTGTLTRGEIAVGEVECFGNAGREECAMLAAALERYSEHPIARAFTDGSSGRVPEAESVTLERGAGVEGRVDGRLYRIGSPAFAAGLYGGEPLSREGSWVALADEKGVLAGFQMVDRLRDDAQETVGALREFGLQAEIASGDDPSVVGAVANHLGLNRWQGRMSPEDKLARIRSLQAEGQRVIVVGDGVNDAPVLAGADVSAAMNAGTALAQTSADMVILGDRLRPLVDGVAGARGTLRIMKQNIGLSAGYNFSALPLAAAGFLTPWMGALGMTVSSLVVVLNAGRLRRIGRQRLPVSALRVTRGTASPRRATDPGEETAS